MYGAIEGYKGQDLTDDPGAAGMRPVYAAARNGEMPTMPDTVRASVAPETMMAGRGQAADAGVKSNMGGPGFDVGLYIRTPLSSGPHNEA